MTESTSSFSSHGEDRVLLGLLERYAWLPKDGERGRFVDVGAYHPRVASNSALFYDLGWQVTAVEPNPYMAELWRSEQPQAYVVQKAVNLNGTDAVLYFFYDWASSNTLDANFAAAIALGQGLEAAREVPVSGTTLAAVMELASSDGPVHVLNVDVEGLDLEVLSSNDWVRFRPLIVCVEDLDLSLAAPEASPTYEFLTRQGYVLKAHVVLSSIYVDHGRDPEQQFFQSPATPSASPGRVAWWRRLVGS